MNGDWGHGSQGQSCNVAENGQLGHGNVAQNRQLGHANVHVHSGGHGMHGQNNRGHQPSIENTVQVASTELVNIFCSTHSRGSQGISSELVGNIFSSNAAIAS